MNETLLKKLYDDDFIKNLVYLEETDSTNNEAIRLAKQGAPSGTLVIAEAQTSGKGRMGRSWNSPPGTGIWMSLLLRPEINASNSPKVTLLSALAIVKALSDYETAAKIKWPNDILINNKKICGILTEMVSCGNDNYIIVGMGMNVSTKSFPAEIQNIATSVLIETGVTLCREKLIRSIMNYFNIYYRDFLKTESLSFMTDEYNSYLINRDNPVILSSQNVDFPDNPYTAIGINKEGALIVMDKHNTLHEITSGEISVRGVYGYGV